jgi:hypothetical protein
MMNQHPQELRLAAARAFIESLDQLQETLQDSITSSARPFDQPISAENPPLEFNLATFEQAIADIEAFMERQQDAET